MIPDIPHIGKPPWSIAPPWAEFLAMDGPWAARPAEWWWFAERPILTDRCWWSDGAFDIAGEATAEERVAIDWRDSLEERLHGN